MLWLDKYERRARLVPGLFALAPVIVLINAFGLRQLPLVSLALSALALGGGPVLLAEVVRRLGRDAQEVLWASWGGSPTTQFLRLTNQTVNSVQRSRWRESLEKLTGVRLAGKRSEQANPTRADELIEAATAHLRDLTRDKEKFALLLAENLSYGFHRNIYGARKIARAIAAGSMLVLGGGLIWHGVADGRAPKPYDPVLLGLILNSLVLLGWVLLPTVRGVRDAADRYAEQLLNAGILLAKEQPTSAGSSSQVPGQRQAKESAEPSAQEAE